MSTCQLIVSDDRQARKLELLSWPSTRYIIDHDTHLKRVGDCLSGGGDSIVVKDETEHFDEALWDVATDAARYIIRKAHDPAMAVGILVHYVHNIFALPEAEHMEKLAANRRWIDLTMTPEEAHGWELEALRKAGLLP